MASHYLNNMVEGMMQINNPLFTAFHKDHATLGRGFFDLRAALLRGSIEEGQQLAHSIDINAGAHIAFEEHDFYPALHPFLSRSEIDDIYKDHEAGAALIDELLKLDPKKKMSKAMIDKFIQRIDVFEAHIADCGQLFGVMGNLSREEQSRLLGQLQMWRKQHPTWRDVSEVAKAARDESST
ncbi:MAG: hemerythrin domain-containing protein [Pseudomonadota bacterium]